MNLLGFHNHVCEMQSSAFWQDGPAQIERSAWTLISWPVRKACQRFCMDRVVCLDAQIDLPDTSSRLVAEPGCWEIGFRQIS